MLLYPISCASCHFFAFRPWKTLLCLLWSFLRGYHASQNAVQLMQLHTKISVERYHYVSQKLWVSLNHLQWPYLFLEDMCSHNSKWNCSNVIKSDNSYNVTLLMFFQKRIRIAAVNILTIALSAFLVLGMSFIISTISLINYT